MDADDSNGETEEEVESSGGSGEEGDRESTSSGSESEERGVPSPGRFSLIFLLFFYPCFFSFFSSVNFLFHFNWK